MNLYQDKRILKGGTAIGEGVCETEFAQSETDYTDKLSIALKETNETVKRLNLLKNTHCLDLILFKSLESDCKELIVLMVSMIKTLEGKE